MATKKITLNELRSIVKQIIKEENSNDFLKFIKQTRLNYIHKWEKEIEKYEEHIKMYMNKSHLSETDKYAIKLKEDEIERLKQLINIYSK